MVRRLRTGSGIILFVYLLTHYSNHALGLISLDAMEAGREWFVLPVNPSWIELRVFPWCCGPCSSAAPYACRAGRRARSYSA